MFSNRARRRVRWLRRTLALAVIGAVALWAAGLVGFAGSLPRAVERPDAPSDAIVVLTGGSERLGEGLRLLTGGHARKLFVSGVYRGVDVAELLAIAQQGPADFADRIALGHEADDTPGNAQETAQWMAAEGFTSLRLVTAGYHMPRSLLEFHHAMPGIELIAHPVFPRTVRLDDWWRWPGTAVLLATEYSKYLLSRLRLAVTGPAS